MGFLKSCLIAFLLVALQACNSKPVQPTPEATATGATPAAEIEPQATNTLPQFQMVDAAGKQVELQSFKGKKVLVNLWATWCPPCRAEMPSIEKLYQAVDKENVQFVLLSLDNDFETAKQYVQKNNLSVPVYYPAGPLPNLFSVNGIPTTFIFDEAGALLAQREGSENYNTAAYRNLFGAAK